eukprot:1148459-Pelagomonas_calceolata.AAC.2
MGGKKEQLIATEGAHTEPYRTEGTYRVFTDQRALTQSYGRRRRQETGDRRQTRGRSHRAMLNRGNSHRMTLTQSYTELRRSHRARNKGTHTEHGTEDAHTEHTWTD